MPYTSNMPLWLLVLSLFFVFPAAFTVRAAEDPSRNQLVDLKAEPRLVSPYDKSLLEAASYRLPDDGSVRDSSERALNKSELKEVLAALREARRKEGLAVFEQAQSALHVHLGRLPREQWGRVQFVLARDWEVIPADIRAGMNDLLKSHGARTVDWEDLRWAQDVQKAWENKQPFEYELPAYAKDPAAAVRRIIEGLGQPQHMPRPPPAEVNARMRELQGAGALDESGRVAPYDARIMESLGLIAGHASAQDWEGVRRFLAMRAPIWISNAEAAPYAHGAAWTPDGFPELEPDGKPVARIVLPEYHVGYKVGDGVDSLPHPHPSFYEERGLPVPQVLALDPKNKGTLNADGDEVFPDGSLRQRPARRERADTLLHEILHIDTYGLGAGNNDWANEKRSFAAANRLIYNMDESRGLTDEKDYGQDNDWLKRPLAYWEGLLAAYMSPAAGEVRPDEITVAGHLARIEKALAARGPELEVLKREEIERHIKRYSEQEREIVRDLAGRGFLSDEQALLARKKITEKMAGLKESPLLKEWDFRAYLLNNKKVLLKDQELTLRVFLDDWKWHQSRGYPYGLPQEPPSIKKKGSPAEPPVPAVR